MTAARPETFPNNNKLFLPETAPQKYQDKPGHGWTGRDRPQWRIVGRANHGGCRPHSLLPHSPLWTVVELRPHNGVSLAAPRWSHRVSDQDARFRHSAWTPGERTGQLHIPVTQQQPEAIDQQRSTAAATYHRRRRHAASSFSRRPLQQPPPASPCHAQQRPISRHGCLARRRAHPAHPSPQPLPQQLGGGEPTGSRYPRTPGSQWSRCRRRRRQHRRSNGDHCCYGGGRACRRSCP